MWFDISILIGRFRQCFLFVKYLISILFVVLICKVFDYWLVLIKYIYKQKIT